MRSKIFSSLALNKDLKVAALTILTIVGFVFAYLFMKGTLLHSGNPEYAAIFDNVDKVKKSDKVYLNGVVIGVVNEISFDNINRPKEIKLKFSADKNLQIPRDSKIQIISTSLMGNMGLNLILGSSKDIVKQGETITGVPENGMMNIFKESVAPVAESSNMTFKNLNTLFDRKQQENLYITINELNKTLANANAMMANMNKMVAENQKPINHTMANIDKMTSALASNTEDVNKMIRNMRDITDKTNQADIGAMMNKLDKSLGELNKTMYEINNGNGSLTKLIKDPALYSNLNATVYNANELMIDFKANPKRYVSFSVFGGKK